MGQNDQRQATADDGEQSLEHLQRQMTAGKGKCPGGHTLAPRPGCIAAGCVAVRHLQHESLDGGSGRQITLAPNQIDVLFVSGMSLEP